MSNMKRARLAANLLKSMNWNKEHGPVLWGKFIRASIGFAATTLLSKLSLFMAELPEPLHNYSLLVLAISLLIAMFSIRAIWIWMRSLNILRSLRFITTIYVIAVLVIAMATTEESGFVQAVTHSASQIPKITFQRLYANISGILNYPLVFSHAYNRRSSVVSLDAVPANESIRLNLDIENVKSNTEVSFGLGMSVEMNAEAKKSCQLDALSDKAFFEWQEVIITEGPRFGEGVVWWHLRNDAGTAWCPETVIS